MDVARKPWAVLDPLLPVSEQTSENSDIKSTVFILKGDLLLMEGPSHLADAVKHYRRAIELASHL
ncbi:MAG: hypothetical protein JO166_24720 [Deltaproteobacteria bacterium]|nr:hypothetical protein [Deltaproteobacteria bacterium]